MVVIAVLQQIPPDHRGGYDLESREVQVEAADYETGTRQIAAEVPDGWRIIAWRVHRDTD